MAELWTPIAKGNTTYVDKQLCRKTRVAEEVSYSSLPKVFTSVVRKKIYILAKTMKRLSTPPTPPPTHTRKCDCYEFMKFGGIVFKVLFTEFNIRSW